MKLWSMNLSFLFNHLYFKMSFLSKVCSYFTMLVFQMTVRFHNATFHHRVFVNQQTGPRQLCNWLLLRSEWHRTSYTTHIIQSMTTHKDVGCDPTCTDKCEHTTCTCWHIKCTMCSEGFCQWSSHTHSCNEFDVFVSVWRHGEVTDKVVCPCACEWVQFDKRIKNIITKRFKHKYTSNYVTLNLVYL